MGVWMYAWMGVGGWLTALVLTDTPLGVDLGGPAVLMLLLMMNWQ